MSSEADTIKKEKAILLAIEQGDRKILHQQYHSHRTAFIQWASRRYQCEEEALIDVYQEAFIVFYQNLVSKKLTGMKCSIRTYIFSVAKNLLFKQFRKNARKEDSSGDDFVLLAADELNMEERLVLSDRQKSLKSAIASLGKVCQQLLTLFYYHELDQESIMKRMQYKNRQTVKSQKVRCMRQLEALVKGKFLEDLI